MNPDWGRMSSWTDVPRHRWIPKDRASEVIPIIQEDYFAQASQSELIDHITLLSGSFDRREQIPTQSKQTTKILNFMSNICIIVLDFVAFVKNTIHPPVAFEPLFFRHIDVVGRKHNVEGTISSRRLLDTVTLCAWTMETDNTHWGQPACCFLW